MNPIGLCMSTGRCGTTYLAHLLKAAYEPEFGIFHEDAPERTSKPNRYLRFFDEEDFAQMRADPDVADYLARFAKHLTARPLIELGNSIVPLVPLLIATFPGRIRILHLVRDPVTTAASFTTFLMYTQGLEIGNMPPDPIHTRCVHSEYADAWEFMSPFEKNLWRWGEYNLLALEIHERHPELPYMKLTSDELFRDPLAARRVARFFGLPSQDIRPRPDKRNESNPFLRAVSPVGEEWRRFINYPYILELAQRLGVPVKTEGLAEKMKSYAAPSSWELARHRWRMRFNRQWLKEKATRWVSQFRKAASGIF